MFENRITLHGERDTRLVPTARRCFAFASLGIANAEVTPRTIREFGVLVRR
jgi:hypothetical protein